MLPEENRSLIALISIHSIYRQFKITYVWHAVRFTEVAVLQTR